MSASFRVTQRSTTYGVQANLQRSIGSLQALQDKLSSGREIGRPSDSPGGTATALYELIPAAPSDARQKPNAALLTVKLSYVAPGSSARRTIEATASDAGAGWLKSSDDFRWAACVATFGMLLRSESANDLGNWKQLSQLFRNSSGGPRHEERTRFAAYVEKTIELVSARTASGSRK